MSDSIDSSDAEGAVTEGGTPLPFAPQSSSWLSAALLFAPLSLLAELLIAKTNHRPLGAATFATIAALGWVCAELLSRRYLDASVCSRRARTRQIAWVGSALASVAVLVRALA